MDVELSPHALMFFEPSQWIEVRACLRPLLRKSYQNKKENKTVEIRE